MASQKMAVIESLKAKPIGMGENEGGLQAPINQRTEIVICKVRNLSAVRKRRRYLDYISPFGGGEEYAREQQERGKTVSLELLQQQAARGRNPSPTIDEISPIDIVLKFDNGSFVIPYKHCARCDSEQASFEAAVERDPQTKLLPPPRLCDHEGRAYAPWIDRLPSGIYDLYMGNYARMHSSDPTEMSAEVNRVKTRRTDYCLRYTDNDRRREERNPWAFVDWHYEIHRPEPAAIDQERVYAGELVEI